MRLPRPLRVLALAPLAALVAALVAPGAAVAAPTAEPGATASGTYVALGDSYATAPGTREYDDPDHECRRGPLSYPRLYAAENPSMNFVEASCSGATVPEVLNSQVPQIPSDAGAISVQVGGNDVGFVDVLKHCIMTIDDQDCVDAVEEAKQLATNSLPGTLDQLYASVGAAAPNAKVVVVGYPRLYTVGGSCSLGLSDTERTALNSAADTLSSVISARAAEAGFSYLDARPVFDPHTLCSDGPEWVTSLEWSKLNESYHPNVEGHRDGYLPALRALLS